MAEAFFDSGERAQLCDLLDELGPDAPTHIESWTTRDLAAHLALREHDALAGPGLVLPGAWGRFAERRRTVMATQDFSGLVATIRSGPPSGFFSLSWVRRVPNLNEFFVHHEDVRRANGLAPRPGLPDGLQAALWSNVCQGGRHLSRRLRGTGLEIAWAGTGERMTVREGAAMVRLSGPPGELLLYLFGRQAAAQVEVTGPDQARDAVARTHFGM